MMMIVNMLWDVINIAAQYFGHVTVVKDIAVRNHWQKQKIPMMNGLHTNLSNSLLFYERFYNDRDIVAN